MFFFEKKNQKTFTSFANGNFFFKKEVISLPDQTKP